jgi:hypothetical protein
MKKQKRVEERERKRGFVFTLEGMSIKGRNLLLKLFLS